MQSISSYLTWQGWTEGFIQTFSSGGSGLHVLKSQSTYLQILSAVFFPSLIITASGFSLLVSKWSCDLRAISFKWHRSGSFFSFTKPWQWILPLDWYSNLWQCQFGLKHNLSDFRRPNWVYMWVRQNGAPAWFNARPKWASKLLLLGNATPSNQAKKWFSKHWKSL